jgi:uncharacterized membrane protein
MSGSVPGTNGVKVNGVKINGMPKALRWSLYGVGAGLWLSGCVWLVLHLFFEAPTQFGIEPHPWESPLLLVHGVLAVPALYLLGWVTSRHVIDGWRMARRRLSGGLISGVLVFLALSGFALFFFTDDAVRAAVALLHEVIGVACLVPALAHWQTRSAPIPEAVPGTATRVFK